jgi:hypothetical protein
MSKKISNVALLTFEGAAFNVTFWAFYMDDLNKMRFCQV